MNGAELKEVAGRKNVNSSLHECFLEIAAFIAALFSRL
jgi:hypothetical protein